VSFIVDLFAKKIITGNATYSKGLNLVMTPLRMAMRKRQREGHPVEPGELIVHADVGSLYTSITFTERREIEGIHPSIGSVPDEYDNALMVTVIRLFKTECIRTTVFHAGPFRTIADVEWATAGRVHLWNNP